MAIHKAHNGFHQTITVSFVLFAVSSAMCSQFPASMKKKYVFYIDWAGLFNSIVANPDLRGGGVAWKSFGNQWAEASKTKIIDCFQTPAGSRITKQNSSQGSLKLVLQILQSHIQTEKMEIQESISNSMVPVKLILSLSLKDSFFFLHVQWMWMSKVYLDHRTEIVCGWRSGLHKPDVVRGALAPTELPCRVSRGPLPIYLL